MKVFLLMLIVTFSFVSSYHVEKSKNETKNEVEARGKAGKYALITNLAIVLAAKVGLYKLVLAIALVAASVKILLVMVWASAIYKYVPDPYLHYKKTTHGTLDNVHDKFAPHKEGFEALDLIADFVWHRSRLHFFYVVATKLFVLKMVYGALFYVLIYKAWHFVLWFIHYLKEKKHIHHEYIEDHHFDYDHGYGHGDHGYGQSDASYGPSGHDFSSYDHKPYGFDKHGYGSDYKKRIYDADGSYSVKGQ